MPVTLLNSVPLPSSVHDNGDNTISCQCNISVKTTEYLPKISYTETVNLTVPKGTYDEIKTALVTTAAAAWVAEQVWS